MNADTKSGRVQRAREEQIIVYTAARCEQLIADSARSAGIPESKLAIGVADFISAQTRGQSLGAQDHMPELRRNGAGRDPLLESVEMAGRPYRGAQAQMSQLEKTAELHRQGFGIGEIAEEMGVSHPTVRTYLARSGIHLRPRTAEQTRAAQKNVKKAQAARWSKAASGLSPRQKDCLKLRQRGLSTNEIGEKLGIAAGSVTTHLAAARQKGFDTTKGEK